MPLATAGCARRKSQMMMVVKIIAPNMPKSGATKMNRKILNTPIYSTACQPAAATALPIRPPISAWLLEVGRPHIQVMMFHMIAPASAARMSGTVMQLMSMMPLPTVLAMATPKMNAPTKLAMAARMTACSGVSALVTTMVATALAASWNPLRKSNSRANPITITARWARSIMCVIPFSQVFPGRPCRCNRASPRTIPCARKHP